MLIEKVSYNINWKNFKAGYSIFIPCLDDSSAKKEVLRVTKRLKIEVLIKTVIEDGVRGLRIWRM
jgi:hypothetical protein